jgi:hypothetical protein
MARQNILKIFDAMARQACLENIFMPWHGKHY